MTTFSHLLDFIHDMPYPLKAIVIIFVFALVLFAWNSLRAPPKK